MNIEEKKELFKDHVANFQDLGNIKILDFKNPKSNDYRIRFMFEEDYCRLHISGDLGELIAVNYNNMTYEGFKDFVNNPEYFIEKIQCMSRNLYVFDKELAYEEIKDRLLDAGFTETEIISQEMTDKIEPILYDFSTESGINAAYYEEMDEILPDYWEFVEDIGKQRTDIVDVYLMAFRLARQNLLMQRNPDVM